MDVCAARVRGPSVDARPAAGASVLRGCGPRVHRSACRRPGLRDAGRLAKIREAGWIETKRLCQLPLAARIPCGSQLRRVRWPASLCLGAGLATVDGPGYARTHGISAPFWTMRIATRSSPAESVRGTGKDTDTSVTSEVAWLRSTDGAATTCSTAGAGVCGVEAEPAVAVVWSGTVVSRRISR